MWIKFHDSLELISSDARYIQKINDTPRIATYLRVFNFDTYAQRDAAYDLIEQAIINKKDFVDITVIYDENWNKVKVAEQQLNELKDKAKIDELLDKIKEDEKMIKDLIAENNILRESKAEVNQLLGV